MNVAQTLYSREKLVNEPRYSGNYLVRQYLVKHLPRLVIQHIYLPTSYVLLIKKSLSLEVYTPRKCIVEVIGVFWINYVIKPRIC